MLHNTFPPRSNSALKSLTATLMQEVITMHGKFLKNLSAICSWRSAHIWEKQICLKIQQRQVVSVTFIATEWFFQLKKIL